MFRIVLSVLQLLQLQKVVVLPVLPEAASLDLIGAFKFGLQSCKERGIWLVEGGAKKKATTPLMNCWRCERSRGMETCMPSGRRFNAKLSCTTR